MYTLLKNGSLKKTLGAELPAFAVAIFITEAFYKFGSFVFECIAFLATWYLLSYIATKLLPRK